MIVWKLMRTALESTMSAQIYVFGALALLLAFLTVFLGRVRTMVVGIVIAVLTVTTAFNWQSQYRAFKVARSEFSRLRNAIDLEALKALEAGAKIDEDALAGFVLRYDEISAKLVEGYTSSLKPVDPTHLLPGD